MLVRGVLALLLTSKEVRFECGKALMSDVSAHFQGCVTVVRRIKIEQESEYENMRHASSYDEVLISKQNIGSLEIDLDWARDDMQKVSAVQLAVLRAAKRSLL
jgi:hypothetical protein